MAGRESSGFAAADADLFVDRPWVIVPAGGTSHRHVIRTTAMAWATGARPIELAADAHDRAVAAISHVPLVVAAALVEAAAGGRTGDWPLARTLAASGWASATRLAKGDPEMGAGILATNAAAVGEALRALRDATLEWLELLGGDGQPDAAALRERLAAARQVLEEDAE